MLHTEQVLIAPNPTLSIKTPSSRHTTEQEGLDINLVENPEVVVAEQTTNPPPNDSILPVSVGHIHSPK